MSGVVLLLAALAAAPEPPPSLSTRTSTTRRHRREPDAPAPALCALLLPLTPPDGTPTAPALDPGLVRGFSGALLDAASSVLAWRRWELVSEGRLQAALAEREPCADELCARALAASLGATSVLFSRLTRQKDGSCLAFAALHDLLRPEAGRAEKAPIQPCTADNVLAVGTDLGRRLTEGPRAPVRVSLNLTPRELPSLDLPSIPDVDRLATTTATRARRSGTLESALDIYRRLHMFVFEDKESHDGFYVARDGKVLDECGVRRAASAPISPDVLEFCEGNDWEWAWTGFGVGSLVALGSAADGDLGDNLPVLGFGLGLALGSAILAVGFDMDRVDATEGRFASSRDEIERIVHDSNVQLRNTLELSEAEVQLAGMRL